MPHIFIEGFVLNARFQNAWILPFDFLEGVSSNGSESMVDPCNSIITICDNNSFSIILQYTGEKL